MPCITVTTQTALDTALTGATDRTCIHIQSDPGIWVTLTDTGSASVRAFGSASVEAFGSASVQAFDSASVQAFDSASVQAFGSASVQAFDSASVQASDSASVQAFGSASVRASGSASVRASGSASVEAFGSASVEAFGSASVEAFGSASVQAFGRSTVTASPHVAVHLHSAQASVTGGVLIDLTTLDLTDPASWCTHHGVTVADGIATLHKALDADLTAGHSYGRPTTYPVGETVTAADWRDDLECGGGLHLSPVPAQATAYHDSAVRWVACEVPVNQIRPIVDGGTPKCKVPQVLVVREVDRFGRTLTDPTVTR